MALNNTHLVNDLWLGSIAQEIVDLHEFCDQPSDDHRHRTEKSVPLVVFSEGYDMGDWQGHEEEAAERFNAGLIALYEMLDYRYLGSGIWSWGYDVSDEWKEFETAASNIIAEWVANHAFVTFCDDPYGITE